MTEFKEYFLYSFSIVAYVSRAFKGIDARWEVFLIIRRARETFVRERRKTIKIYYTEKGYIYKKQTYVIKS